MNDQWRAGETAPASAESAPTPSFSEVLSFSWRILSASLGAVIPFVGVCLVIETVLGGALIFYATPENLLFVSLVQISLSLFLITPVVTMAGARLSLSLWDGEPTGLSAFAVGLALYRDALAIFLSYFLYLLMLALMSTLVTFPVGLIVGLTYPSGGAVQLMGIAGGLALALWLIRIFIWGRARRIVPFLCDINCFLRLEGRSEGGWFASTGLWYTRLNDSRFSPFLNGALIFLVVVDLAKMGVFVLMGGLGQTGLAVSDIGFNLFLNLFQTLALLWLTITGAGFYRLILKSGAERGSSDLGSIFQ
jgi:hypothetical protein